ncbi:MAG: acyl carrier protein [Lachnospiraceae bacterium]|nr:acyl carrier protein [Lachnospiraceae bacterium]
MNIVNSHEPLEKVVYKIGTDGIANVWIRQEASSQETEEGYIAEEVYFKVTPSVISKEEILADSGFFFTAMCDEKPGSMADHLQLEVVRKAKRDQISAACQAIIFAGIDVELSEGVQHFSLTETDQINLFGKMAQLQSGAERLEYHSDGAPCCFYSAADMAKICAEATKYVSLMTTICNSLFVWLANCTTRGEIAGIEWGAEIPDDYKSEVLKAYLAADAAE